MSRITVVGSLNMDLVVTTPRISVLVKQYWAAAS